MRRGVKNPFKQKSTRSFNFDMFLWLAKGRIEMDREREIVRGVKDEQTTETVWQFLALLRRFLFPSAPSPAWHLPLTIARNLSFASAFALLFYCQFVALPLFVVVSIADIKRKMAMPAPKYDLILTANTLSCVTALHITHTPCGKAGEKEERAR